MVSSLNIEGCILNKNNYFYVRKLMTLHFVLYIFLELNDLSGLNTIHEENKIFRIFCDFF